MKKSFIIILLIVFVFALSSCEDEPVIIDEPEEICLAPSDYSQTLTYEMVWNDEFDGDTLDLSKWVYEVDGNGGGNNELQYYTRDNTIVSDGTLKIIAKYEEYEGKEYTSSRIKTSNSAYYKYGIFEVRAKLPSGRGTWPAIWMMPKYSRYGGWPSSGEIDIMEHVGYDENIIHSTIHTNIYNHISSKGKGSSTSEFTNVTEEFHTYKLIWLPDKIEFFVDDEITYTYEPNRFSGCPTYKVWPFNASFYMILNVAVGGDWGGVQGVDETAFPTQLEVDYVRIYQALELENYDDHSE